MIDVTAPQPSSGKTVVVAALSARYLAEAARQAGWRVIALDLFGDADTRRASAQWRPIGRPQCGAIDAAQLRDALLEFAQLPGLVGWIAGAGFEADPDLLDAGGDRLRRLGPPRPTIERLREPRHFFAALDRLGLLHPPVATVRPLQPRGWLHKRAGGCGGVHVAPAGIALPAAADSYWQRWQPGRSMSALFVADGRGVRLVALNLLTTCRIGAASPFVFAGACSGPTDAALQRRVECDLAALTTEFALRGLLSADFIEVGGRPCWLEINPRPSASMQLHAAAWPAGLLAAHCDALAGRLPALPSVVGRQWRGFETLFADHDGLITARIADELAADPHLHDLPVAGQHYASAAPICSVSAEAADLPALRGLLAQRLNAVRRRLAAPAIDRIHQETDHGHTPFERQPTGRPATRPTAGRRAATAH